MFGTFLLPSSKSFSVVFALSTFRFKINFQFVLFFFSIIFSSYFLTLLFEVNPPHFFAAGAAFPAPTGAKGCPTSLPRSLTIKYRSILTKIP